MRTAALATLGVVAGFLAGVVVSEIVGVVGVLGFGRAVGMRYLPVWLAVAGAVAVPVAVRHVGRRRSRWPRRDTTCGRGRDGNG